MRKIQVMFACAKQAATIQIKPNLTLVFLFICSCFWRHARILYLFSHRRCRAQAWPSSLSLKPWPISQPHLFGLWCSSLCWWIWDWAACSALYRASLPPLWTPSKYGRNTSQVSQCQKKPWLNIERRKYFYLIVSRL